MSKHNNWRKFVWSLLQHFGKECCRTWWQVMIGALVTGFAAAGAGYLRTHGRLSFTDSLQDGMIGAALVFGIYALFNLVRTPWLEYKGDGGHTLWHGLSGVVVLCLLVSETSIICWFVAADLRSTITISGHIDPGHKQADEIIALEECKSTLASLTKSAPLNSLRYRTIELVNDLNLFWVNRPTPPQQAVQNPVSDDDRARNAKWERYWNETKVAYQNKQFNERVLGITEEYLTKGVPVGYLERSAEQSDRYIGAVPFGGSSLDACDQYMNELCQLRELAFHVDAYDIRIDSSKF